MSPKRVFSLSLQDATCFYCSNKMNKKHNTHNMKGLSIYIKKNDDILPFYFVFNSTLSY
jgi:hypothetical protein